MAVITRRDRRIDFAEQQLAELLWQEQAVELDEWWNNLERWPVES